MKKTIYHFLSLLLSVALLSVAACNKEEPPIDQTDPNEPGIVDPGENGMIINAICDSFEESSRATVLENGAIVWDEYDRIGVFEFVGTARNNGNIRFALEDGLGESAAKFASTSELDAAWSRENRTIYAYYPYQPGNVMVKALPISVPIEIEYDSENPVGHLNASNIMVAEAQFTTNDSAEEITLNFKSLLSPVVLYVENQTDEPFELFSINVKDASGNSIFPKEASLNVVDMQLITAFAETSPTFTINLKESILLEPGDSEEIPLFLYPLNLENGNELSFELVTSRKPITVPANILKGFPMEPALIYFEELSLTEEDFGLLGVEELPNDTNCYMINPPTADGTSMRYLLPITQLNQFWGENSYGDPVNVIEAETKWVAEFLWKDVDIDGNIDLISFTTNGAKGVGPDAMIEIEINCDIDEPFGNAVIAVKKADEDFNPVGEYLWSWHVWVTDYDGELFDLSDGEYNKVMDRNLGAKSGVWGHPGTMGLLYQWGRKDPFIGVQYEYWLGSGTNTWLATTLEGTWEGNRKYFSDAPVNGSVAFAVQHPTSFILSKDNLGNSSFTASDWIHGTRVTDLWHADEKTIFDPCPKGFKIATGDSDGGAFKAMTEEDSPLFPAGAPLGRLYNSEVWFPFSGYLSTTTGNLNYFTTRSYLTTTAISQAKDADETTGEKKQYVRSRYFTNTSFNATYSTVNRGAAIAARCMEWPDDN